jgi:hypothetical protein
MCKFSDVAMTFMWIGVDGEDYFVVVKKVSTEDSK